MFWVLGPEGKPVTRGHSPKTEEGASSKSGMTRPLKSLSLASILPSAREQGGLEETHRWTEGTLKATARQEQGSRRKGRIQEDGDSLDVKETVNTVR